jgi:pimeloyl-ACP methyl ester carboxylesterase
VGHDEFGMLSAYAALEGLAWRGRPPVERSFVEVSGGQQVSAIVWGAATATTGTAPDMLLLHGSGQNAHTWDPFALALDRPLVALDLPGHGHSDWRRDHDYRPATNAAAVAAAAPRLMRMPATVVGMSLGGLTAIHLAARHPELVARVVIVDVTPGVMSRRRAMTDAERGATVLTGGPGTFASFEEMVAAASAVTPGRPSASLRIGVRHNARQLGDGTWAWRYDPDRREAGMLEVESLWADVAKIAVPIMLVRGGCSSFVDDDEEREVLRRQPKARVERVTGAGHSVQSERARELARLVGDFVATT